MKKRTALAWGVLVMLSALVVTYVGYDLHTRSTAGSPMESAAPEPSLATPAADLVQAPQTSDAQERHLVGIVLHEKPAQSRAHIMRRGVTGVFRLQDMVPPDQAVLTSIQIDFVTLQPPVGDEITLRLEKLSKEARFLYSPEINLDEVEDVTGNLNEAETPQGKALLAKYPDPHAPCVKIEDEAEQEKCTDRIEAEMATAAEKCDEIEDRKAFERCLKTAYRFSAEAIENP